jgi:polyamine oxidase
MRFSTRTAALLGLTSGNVKAEVLKTKVAILGGGMSGTMAARTLSQANISDFLIIEAREELGGRMMSTEFMGEVIELGANWVQGTVNNVTNASNPIWDLALKYVFSSHG